VIGVDPERTKVDLINAGKSPIIEKDIGQIIAEQVAAGRLRATTELADAVRHTDMALVCVGTPSQPNGGIDLRYVRRVCEQIGRTLAAHHGAPVIVMRSTMLPGTMREIVLPTLEKFSGKRAGEEFGVCINPEFLREGTAVHDYYHPPKTVIGEVNRASGDLLAAVYASMPGPMIRTDIETAEMVKYADNAWHALKVGFANEIGNVCKALEVDAHQVMEIFCQDLKLNLSPYYLKPGFAFGGSCLPKDVRALLYKAKTLDLSLPILSAILPSNQLQIERGVQAVVDKGNRRVGILGFSFKAGTDDLRESPMVELAERLIGKGYDLRVYDRNVSLAAMHGANRDYILNKIPHISRLMVPTIDEVLAHAHTIVIGNAAPEFAEVPRRIGEHQTVIDFVRVSGSRTVAGVYEGICW
jgi:GDP-mannose 6-dehydrogenase